MAGEKKAQSDSAPKKSVSVPKSEPSSKDKSASDATSSKTEKSGEAPANYSRGEGQKVVSQAYRDNWNEIFGKKTRQKKKR